LQKLLYQTRLYQRDLWRGGALILAIGISGCRLNNHLAKAAFSGWTESKIFPVGELARKSRTVSNLN